MTRAPLNAVRAFEAAARLGSFVRAAAELHVTPSAISHQIRSLEQQLGARLFDRTGAALRLTLPGAEYAREVGLGLQQIERATDRLRSQKRRRLSVATAPHLASRWLLPRLHRFRELHPDIEISIDAGCQVLSPQAAGIDLALRSGLGRWDGLTAEKIMSEWAVLVDRPGQGTHARDPLRERVAGRPLVQLASMPAIWRAWTAAAGLDLDEPTDRIELGDLISVVDAVAAGLGVAIVPWLAARDMVAAGTLEIPAGAPVVQAPASYFVVWPEHARLTSHAMEFTAWLRTEASAFGPPAQVAA